MGVRDNYEIRLTGNCLRFMCTGMVFSDGIIGILKIDEMSC